MSFINRLYNASNSLEDLTAFIQKNSIEIYDFFISQKNRSIVSHRNEIEGFVSSQNTVFIVI